MSDVPSTRASDDSSTSWPYRLVELAPGDAERIKTLEDVVWFEITPGAGAAEHVEGFDFARGKGVEAHAPLQLAGAEAGDRPLVGLYGAFAMHLSVPGPAGGLTRVPMSGLSWVGVHPDHRRRGILRAMMTEHLHGLHHAGQEAVAGLWAAEVGIYGRYGYGPASLQVMLTLSRGAELDVPEPLSRAAEEIATHMVVADSDEASATLQAVHVASAARTLGAVSRPDALARAWFREFPKARGKKEPRQVLFAVRDGAPVGYASFRRTSEWDDFDNPSGELVVGELAAVDSATLLALTRRLLDFDLIGKVKLFARSTDDALAWWAGGPRSAAMKVSDAVWIRLVDVPRALGERGYAAGCDLVIDVADEVCAWNARRWRLSVDPDGVGRCEPSEDEADLELGVQVLGSAYLGGRSIASQHVAGLVTERRPGAVRELSRAMRADTEPLGGSGF